MVCLGCRRGLSVLTIYIHLLHTSPALFSAGMPVHATASVRAVPHERWLRGLLLPLLLPDHVRAIFSPFARHLTRPCRSNTCEVSVCFGAITLPHSWRAKGGLSSIPHPPLQHILTITHVLILRYFRRLLRGAGLRRGAVHVHGPSHDLEEAGGVQQRRRQAVQCDVSERVSLRIAVSSIIASQIVLIKWSQIRAGRSNERMCVDRYEIR